jgi:enoyl-[acyl-carrier protein] reductase I
MTAQSRSRCPGAAKAPIGESVDIMDVGLTFAYPAAPGARRVAGETLRIDGGVNIKA